MRVFDLERPDAAPQQFAAAPGKVRCLVWTSDDALLLSSDIDGPNITCALACGTRCLYIVAVRLICPSCHGPQQQLQHHWHHSARIFCADVRVHNTVWLRPYRAQELRPRAATDR